ncbi:MAG: hypothetical protein JRI80_04915 [Deltaproteobacteria bacterium]|nr:hypothetical protein [Deltaproteobacteria bacterium]
MGETLTTLKEVLCGSDGTQGVLQDASYYSGITDRINDAVTAIAAGIRMPDGMISPPLPDLHEIGSVTTTPTYYADLPDDYQRHLFLVVDTVGRRIPPPIGGDYYDFALFMSQAGKKDLSQAGYPHVAVIRGKRLYYQGIPASAMTLPVHYYRKPVAMAADDDEVDGLPDHLQKRLIKHYVAREVFGELEDGEDSLGIGYKYHTARFYEAMTELIDFIGIDGTPEYYGQEGFIDLGVCD